MAINHEDVVRVAREVFPGLTDEHITVRGRSETNLLYHWTVSIRLGDSPDAGFEVIAAKTEEHPMGGGGKLCRVGHRQLPDESSLRLFLEACHDALAKNLEAVLAIVLGPLRVLPKDDWLETRPIHELLGLAREFLGSPALTEVLSAYEAGVAHRRAKRAAAAK